jgi:hypothetical protein
MLALSAEAFVHCMAPKKSVIRRIPKMGLTHFRDVTDLSAA